MLTWQRDESFGALDAWFQAVLQSIVLIIMRTEVCQNGNIFVDPAIYESPRQCAV